MAMKYKEPTKNDQWFSCKDDEMAIYIQPGEQQCPDGWYGPLFLIACIQALYSGESQMFFSVWTFCFHFSEELLNVVKIAYEKIGIDITLEHATITWHYF